jgi:hypothetical protein
VPLFAHITQPGAIHAGQLPDAVAVLESPHNLTPIGVAYAFGRVWPGLALWRLRVRGRDIPGAWIIIDCEFRPVP